MQARRVLISPVLKWAARRAIVGRNRYRDHPERGRFAKDEVDRLLEQGWSNFEQLAPNLPREPTFGSRMNVWFGCLTLACFRALVSAGVERDYATELLTDSLWKIYEKWGIVPRIISKAIYRDPQQRMRKSVEMFLRFPFNPPGYRFEMLPDPTATALNMLRCPVADYFRSQDAGDVCVASWCQLDFALAEIWGGHAERNGTLAAGDNACAFRWSATDGGRGAGVE